MALVTAKVEFSRDDLSDTTPTWTDITTYVRDVRWWSGKASDLDPPQDGGCTILLNNQDRRFEPDYSAGAYSPDIKPMRRFRLTMTADGTAHPQGIYYASNWGVGYPARTTYSETTVTCVDGFGILSLDTLPLFDPPGASTYIDVIQSDDPFLYYQLAEQIGKRLLATVGTDGVYKGTPIHVSSNPVVGDPGYACDFSQGGATYGRIQLDDLGVFKDAGEFTLEAVIDMASVGNRVIIGIGYISSAGDFVIKLTEEQLAVNTASGATGTTISSPGTGAHHVAATWDGGTLTFYVDGVAVQSAAANATAIGSSDANEFVYIGGSGHGEVSPDGTISHVAAYLNCLTPTQIANHATAATNHGYATQTTGSRVASLATNALWSTAGITGGQTISVAPRFQTGQARLGEINLVTLAEQPSGLFYFDDSGDPAYQGWDYTPTSAATFSDSASDVPYEAITLAYDDDLYNTVTIARDGGDAQTHTDTASESAYMTRGYNQTGLILSTDADADLVAADVLTNFSTPRIRVTSITLNSASQTARLQMLTREIGDTIRVKRRTDTGEAIDVITRILGKQKHIGPDGNLTCTWNLSRGIDASDATWHLGVTGYSELNTTTILA